MVIFWYTNFLEKSILTANNMFYNIYYTWSTFLPILSELYILGQCLCRKVCRAKKGPIQQIYGLTPKQKYSLYISPGPRNSEKNAFYHSYRAEWIRLMLTCHAYWLFLHAVLTIPRIKETRWTKRLLEWKSWPINGEEEDQQHVSNWIQADRLV